MNSKVRSPNNKSHYAIEKFLPIALLIFISALVYLPLIRQFGYYFDDWYFMYAGGVKGGAVFKDIWSIDRPGAAFFMQPLYSFFGQNALYYNLSAYFFRLLSALGLLSTARLLWPREKIETSTIALLYLIYPGFLSQPNGIVYQFYLVGLAAATWSIALTVRAITANSKFRKFWYFTFSIILGLIYLAQIEWYIGFEAIRWACVFVIVYREKRALWPTALKAVQRAWSTFLVPSLFLGWRIFFFESERGATDVGLQLSGVFAYPLQTMFSWVNSLIQNMFSALLTAWVSPLTRFSFSMDNANKAVGLAIGFAAIIAWYFGSSWITKNENVDPAKNLNWRNEALWIGFIGLAFGVVPVVIANRAVAFPSYSRYTLVSSLGAVTIIVVGLSKLSKAYMRKIAISALILISTLTHYGNGLEYAKWANEYRDFWWQVSWRVPQLEKNTTLVVNYAVGATEEDYFVWGPANLIYYPEGIHEKYVQPGVYAALLNQDTIIKTLLNEGQEFNNRRTIRTYQNYRKLLIMTQSNVNSCVHVIDGEQPEYSRQDSASIQILGPYSGLEQILPDGSAPTPPPVIFGSEPEHNWCYFYQRASLARQRGEWNEIVRLGQQAQEQGFDPADAIEWMPFLQAYVELGDEENVTELASQITPEPYVAMQACQFMKSWQEMGSSIPESVLDLYCLAGESQEY